jgi:L-lactate dehydrogenase complex protein LldG
MAARDLVLKRIRAALTDVRETPGEVDVPRDYRRSHAGDDVVGLFTERVEDYKATVVRTTPAQAAAEIARLVEGRSLVVPAGFPPELVPDVAVLSDEPALSVRELDAADGVLTLAAVGIAVTGTIVLDAGPGQGRRALTLLPDYHLCVVRSSQIAGDVPGALERLDPVRPLTFISGPSATSDIELERVEGVHGPRVLHVVIIEEE